MKQTFLALTCVTLLVGVSGARAQDQAYPTSDHGFDTSGTDSGFVGDEDDIVGDYGDFNAPIVQTGSFVGDMNSVGDMNYADDTNSVGDMGHGDSTGVLVDAIPSAEYAAPTPLAQTYNTSSSYMSCDPCTPTTLYAAVTKPAPRKWLRAESLLWFLDGRDTPPLVRVYDPGTPTNVVIQPNGNSEFGNPITSGLAPGFRFDYGHYFTDNVGVGARVWGLFGEDEDYSISAPAGSSVIVRPYFNTTRLGGPNFDALIVAGIGGASGGININSEFDMIATEVYGRLKFGATKDYRIDLLGGYSYFGIDDMLGISSTSVLAGEQFTFSDNYETENRFYGGQVGLETVINKGRWSLTSLTKVHLGNMNQRVAINGFSQSVLLPNPPGPITNTADQNGLYVQGQEGIYEEDVFTFVPEMNFRLGYSPRDQIHLTLGYTFAYWSSVALAGDQANPVVDGINTAVFANTPGAQSAGYEIVNDGFWMQGIDLGVTFTF